MRLLNFWVSPHKQASSLQSWLTFCRWKGRWNCFTWPPPRALLLLDIVSFPYDPIEQLLLSTQETDEQVNVRFFLALQYVTLLIGQIFPTFLMSANILVLESCSIRRKMLNRIKQRMWGSEKVTTWSGNQLVRGPQCGGLQKHLQGPG